MENLDCSMCMDIFDRMNHKVKFDDPETNKLVLVSFIESIGESYGCGEDRFICLPLLKIMSGEYGEIS